MGLAIETSQLVRQDPSFVSHDSPVLRILTRYASRFTDVEKAAGETGE